MELPPRDFESRASTNFTTPALESSEGRNYGTVQCMKYPTIEDAIGRTPMVALQRIGAAGNEVRGNVLLGKLEGNNPAGSVKDRLALNIIEAAERDGRLKPGQTVVEATSGNTGIGLAMVCAAKGYPLVVSTAPRVYGSGDRG